MTDTLTPEVWTSPAGVEAELHAAAFDPYVPETEDEYYDAYEWHADFPGQRPPQRYKMVAADGTVVDDFVVSPCGGWSAYDAASDRLVREGWAPPPYDEAECEHGLSLALCAGPGHYPSDEAF